MVKVLMTIKEASDAYGDHVNDVHKGEPVSQLWSAGASHAVAKEQLVRAIMAINDITPGVAHVVENDRPEYAARKMKDAILKALRD